MLENKMLNRQFTIQINIESDGLPGRFHLSYNMLALLYYIDDIFNYVT